MELVASQSIRLERNKTENRIKHKPSKIDTELSELRLLESDSLYRTESLDGEIKFDNYIKIDNSYLSPSAVAEMIKEQFNFK